MSHINVINNTGIISTGSHAQNIVNIPNTSHINIDWQKLGKEIADLKESCDLESMKNFANQAASYVEKKNYDGLMEILKKLGNIGLEIIIKSSANVLVELAKKAMVI